MPAKVLLTVTRGKLQGQEFAFEERTTFLVGRAPDCGLRLPNDTDHRTISRHHCLLDINPPDIRVRDFGSRNGTLVNGARIGQRGRHQSAAEGGGLASPDYDLKNGDEVRIGGTVFRVGVAVPAVCVGCAVEIPEEQRAGAETKPGIYQCASCRQVLAQTTTLEDLVQRSRACAQCGRDLGDEMGSRRSGELICRACQQQPLQIVTDLLRRAAAGDPEVAALAGCTLLRELGRGGMGGVYLVRHTSGSQVALKVMLPRVAANARAKALFLREMDNTKALRHANVVALCDSGCARGTFFFTMDYCDGGSLDRVLAERGGTLPLAEAGPIILQALTGLEYAHQAEIPYVRRADGSFGPGRGLVHRDLKPHNLFLAGSGAGRVVKIGDYGLAKAFDAAGLSGQTRTGSIGGTPYFMSRQQVTNFKYARPEVDVWAMAACFYYLLTGQCPRDFPPGKDPWLTILRTAPTPIRARNPAVPEPVAAVIDRALTEEPAIPFQTAGELRAALSEVL